MSTEILNPDSAAPVIVAWRLSLYLCCDAVLRLKICYAHLFVDILAAQDGFDGVIDELIKRHSPCVWDDSFNGRLFVMRLLNEEIHNQEENEFALGTDEGEKATSDLIEPIKSTEE